jgi:hypothetical protein
MELPSEIMIHNQLLGLKGTPGSLLHISSQGFYEITCKFGDSSHRVLLPISSTVLISRDPEIKPGPQVEIER